MNREKVAYELFVGVSDPEEDGEYVGFASFGVQRLMLQHLPKHNQTVLQHFLRLHATTKSASEPRQNTINGATHLLWHHELIQPAQQPVEVLARRPHVLLQTAATSQMRVRGQRRRAGGEGKV